MVCSSRPEERKGVQMIVPHGGGMGKNERNHIRYLATTFLAIFLVVGGITVSARDSGVTNKDERIPGENPIIRNVFTADPAPLFWRRSDGDVYFNGDAYCDRTLIREPDRNTSDFGIALYGNVRSAKKK